MLLLALPWILAFVPNVPLQASAPPPAEPPPQASEVERGEPVPVVVWNRQIVVLRSPRGSQSARQRADQIVERVLALPELSFASEVEAEEVRIGTQKGVNFGIGGRFLFTLLESDVDPALGETLEGTAEETRERLAELLQARRAQRQWPVILAGAGLTIAATLVLIAALWLISAFKRGSVRRIRTLVARSERLRVREIDLRPYVGEASERTVGVLAFVSVGAVLYVWLDYCLARFPYTAPWSLALDQYLTDLLGWTLEAVARAVPDLLIVVLIFFVTRGITRTVTLIVSRIERRAERAEGVAPESVRATRRLAVVILWIFGVVLAYPHLPGAGSDAFKGVSVLLGLMVSLGSAGLVNQVMSGFVVLYSRSVRSGEVVRIGEIEGQVVDLGLLTTKVLQPSGEEVSIPNAVVITQATVNYSRAPGHGRAIASTTVTIGYDTPWRQVRALLLLAAQRVEGILQDPPPRVAQKALSDWFVEYALVFQVEDGKQRSAVLSRLHATIQDTFNEYGVQIMSPHFVGQPEKAVVVPHGREEPEPAPRFRFAREAAPASFDPIEKAAEERARRAAEDAARAERQRLREEREAAAGGEEGGPSEGASGDDSKRPDNPSG